MSVHKKRNHDSEDEIEKALRIMKKSLAKTKGSYTYSPEKTRELSQMIKAKNKKQQIAKLQKLQKPAKQLRPKVIKLETNLRALKKKPIIDLVYLKEHHLLAGGYATPKSINLKRQYAEIKAKNNATLSSCRKANKNKRKRDWTDRFALK